MNDFEKMMADLKREYIAGLPQKILDIQTHLSMNDSATLRDDFHKLKGTGKTYGIPEISELGEAVEKICLKKPENIPSVVPVAIELLRKIHSARLAGQAFNVMGDASFAPALAIAQTIVK
jgi:HPt (histidine-containing phosphotransfer) domain-containing protein